MDYLRQVPNNVNMLRFVGAFALVLATALAAPQLNIPQQQQGQQQQAQAYQATAYQAQSNSQVQGGGSGSQTTPVPIISFDDSQPGDGTFKYR